MALQHFKLKATVREFRKMGICDVTKPLFILILVQSLITPTLAKFQHEIRWKMRDLMQLIKSSDSNNESSKSKIMLGPSFRT